LVNWIAVAVVLIIPRRGALRPKRRTRPRLVIGSPTHGSAIRFVRIVFTVLPATGDAVSVASATVAQPALP